MNKQQLQRAFQDGVINAINDAYDYIDVTPDPMIIDRVNDCMTLPDIKCVLADAMIGGYIDFEDVLMDVICGLEWSGPVDVPLKG